MKKIVIGNWKMNPDTAGEASEIFKKIAASARSLKKTSVIICPPAPFIGKLFSRPSDRVAAGAQDCSGFSGIGPHTGEVSAEMLASVGAKYVILGHSERRALGESDELVNKKIKSALSAGLEVVLCVGEKTRDESGEYLKFIKSQLTACLDKARKDWLKNILVAYEPVWAVGRDALHPATAADFLEVSIFIKKVLAEMFGREVGLSTRVIYGGSVDYKNSLEFLLDGKADGLLVGRESLNSDGFIKILKIADNV